MFKKGGGKVQMFSISFMASPYHSPAGLAQCCTDLKRQILPVPRRCLGGPLVAAGGCGCLLFVLARTSQLFPSLATTHSSP